MGSSQENPLWSPQYLLNYLDHSHSVSASASLHKKENHSHLEIKAAYKNTTTSYLPQPNSTYHLKANMQCSNTK